MSVVLRVFVFLFGFALLLIGTLGFFPRVENSIFSIFEVNFWVNVFHLITGILAIVMGCFTIKSMRMYFQIIGILYAIWAILGFVYGDNAIVGVLANNKATSWLHMILAVSALILGYGEKEKV